MPLDTNIALQVRPVSDPMEAAGNVMSLRSLFQQGQMRDIQMQEAQRKQQEEATLADLYRGAIDPNTGRVDNSKIMQGMAGAGLGSRIPAYQKQVAEADKAQADVGHVNAQTSDLQLKVAKSRLDAVNGALSSLLSRPSVTHDDVIGAMSGLVQQGVIDDKSAVSAIRGLPGDQGQLRSLLLQKALESMDASKRLDAMMPKVQMVNLGGSEQAVDVNPLTNQKIAGSVFNRTATPDALLSASTARRGQDLTNARAIEQNQQGKIPPGYRQLPDGSLQAIPGGPADGGKPLTEFQGKSTGFAVRAKNSSDIIDQVGMDGKVQPGMIKRMGEAVPFAGEGIGTALNWTQSSNQQQVEQAQRDFINSILRQESGAAIGANEFENARKQYFPQPGDSQAVIQQKKQNRENSIRALEISSGPGIKQFNRADSTNTQSVAQQAGPKIGSIQDGYVYSGGDPANPASWKKVK